MQSFDDDSLRAAMRDYLSLSDRLATASSEGQSARDLVDLAESKAVAAMVLRKRLVDLGWSAPVVQRTST
ncbi:MAG: hypothetical protein Q8R60_01400 [Mycobacteriales bacterium]|nr:hypothetical protein [Mycobacteriales bacterium]